MQTIKVTVSGPIGSGKSTILAMIMEECRSLGMTVKVEGNHIDQNVNITRLLKIAKGLTIIVTEIQEKDIG